MLLPLLHNSIDLYIHAHLAHWNLRGENFIAIHRLLDEVSETVDKGTDELAERIRQLGSPVEASASLVACKSKLPAFPPGLVDSRTAVDALTTSIAKVVNDLHQAIDSADEAGDAVTADLLTQISGRLELQLWLLESHLPVKS